MSSYVRKPCAACGKPTSCVGHYVTQGNARYLRYLCDRYVCKRQRADGRCTTCNVRYKPADSAYCHTCKPRGRKVSTEGKSASGQTPDSGSTPDYSTSDEVSVLQEDVQDLREELVKLKKEMQKLRADFSELYTRSVTMPSMPTIPNNGQFPNYTFPDFPDFNWKSS